MDRIFGGNGRFRPRERKPRDDPKKDFPIHDDVVDFTGKKRKFEITYREVGLGFLVIAEEVGKKGFGYEFSAFSPTSPYLALGELRGKMGRSLSTRHIVREGRQFEMAHDTLRGRIVSVGEGMVGFVVDGRLLALEDLERFARSREGWQFRLDFKDSCEEV